MAENAHYPSLSAVVVTCIKLPALILDESRSLLTARRLGLMFDEADFEKIIRGKAAAYVYFQLPASGLRNATDPLLFIHMPHIEAY